MAAGVSSRLLIIAAGAIAVLAPGVARAADFHELVAGWSLDDVGSKPGDDSNRTVAMRKSLADVSLTYSPGERNSSGSIQIKFTRCQGLSYGSGFGFDDPRPDHATQVRRQIAEAFAEFAVSCPAKDQGEARLMAGFDEAFRKIESWVTARPFVYPREELPDTTPDGPATPGAPDEPDRATVPMT